MSLHCAEVKKQTNWPQSLQRWVVYFVWCSLYYLVGKGHIHDTVCMHSQHCLRCGVNINTETGFSIMDLITARVVILWEYGRGLTGSLITSISHSLSFSLVLSLCLSLSLSLSLSLFTHVQNFWQYDTLTQYMYTIHIAYKLINIPYLSSFLYPAPPPFRMSTPFDGTTPPCVCWQAITSLPTV